MKKIISSLFVASFLITGVASAQMGMMGNTQNSATTSQQNQTPTIDSATQDIYKSQGVDTLSKINCSKITDSQFQTLGDAYMGNGITEQQHTAMENMMGGDGSPTVNQAHINMGRAYLGCWANYNSAPSTMGMMGNTAINSNYPMNYASNYRMMGNPYMMNGYHGGFVWFGLLTMVLVWVFLILSIIALIRWLSRNK